MVNEKKNDEDISLESRIMSEDSNSTQFDLKKQNLSLSSPNSKIPLESIKNGENISNDSFEGADDTTKISTQLLSISNNINENTNGFSENDLESDLGCNVANSTNIADEFKHFNFELSTWYENLLPEFGSSDVNGSTNPDVQLCLPLQSDDNLNEVEGPKIMETDISDSPENEKSEPINTVEIQLQDIKSDYSEFDTFVLLFFYINEVYDSEYKFDNNSLEFTFKTNDVNFCRVPGPIAQDNNSPVNYHLKIDFKNEITPEKSYFKIKKKSIEIRLAKAKPLNWGTIKEMCATSIGSCTNYSKSSSCYVLVPTENYSPNTWTPCLPTSSGSQDADDLQLMQCQPTLSDQQFNLSNKGKFYGYTGLENLMNTCFMNAVLQCLSNTDPLRDYFLSNEYVNDINESNPLGHRGIIVKAFAQFLNQLWMGKQSSFAPSRLKNLVGEKITSIFMGFNQHDAQEFMSFFLDAIHEDLNKNHNRPKSDSKKKSNDDDADNEDLFDDTDERHVEVYRRLQAKANEMWSQYLLYNNSIIIDLFCGQFKSILTCPDCTKKSIMFDPFLYVSLPIPPPKITYQVVFFSRENLTGMCKSAYRFVFKLSHTATVNQLLNLVSQKTDVSTKNMRLIQQHANMPPKILNSNWLLSDYHSSSDMPSSSRPLLLFESLKDQYEEYIELCIVQRSLKPVSKYFALNLEKSEEQITPVGFPFIVYLNKSMLSYSYLSSVLCSFARYSVAVSRPLCNETISDAKLSTLKTELHHEFNLNQFNFSAPENIPHFIYYKSCPVNNNDVIAPFILRKSLGFANSGKGEEIVPLVVNEEIVTKEEDLNEIEEEKVSDKEDNKMMDEDKDAIATNSLQTLDANSLLNSSDMEYMVDDSSRTGEIVSREYDNDSVIDLGNNVFYLTMDWINSRSYESHISIKLSTVNCADINNVDCSDLNSDVDITLDECLKSFNEPEVLGPQNCWRCPSCKVLREATKQLSFWRLPPILVIQLKRFKMRDVIYRDKIFQLVKYPINGLDLSKYISNLDLVNDDNDGHPQSQLKKPIYDLYAVVNHIGNAFGGHYTAFAKSFNDKLGWRYFNDCLVENVTESSLVTADAYLLFYKRRAAAD